MIGGPPPGPVWRDGGADRLRLDGRTESRPTSVDPYNRLQIHDPAGGRATGAILVLHRARAAAPVLPPDPLEVVHLEQEEGDDPEQDLGGRHVIQRIGATVPGAMGRVAQPPCCQVLGIRDGAIPEETAPSRTVRVVRARRRGGRYRLRRS